MREKARITDLSSKKLEKNQKKMLTFRNCNAIIIKQSDEGSENADMAELADALDSGSSEVTLIQVQVLLSAP